MRRIPSIGAVMTAFPFAVEAGSPLSDARRMMAELEVRHLPVTDDGRLVGIVDARGLGQAQKHRASAVGEACARDPLVVDLGRRLDGVALEMAEHHADAVLVTRQGKLCGILTHTDVCRILSETLRRQFTPPSGNDAA